MAPDSVVTSTSLPFPKKQGKVRDVYDLGDKLLFIATDRLSAFDVVFNEGIPLKGKCLNQLSLHWFKKFSPNHVITANAAEFPEELRKPELEGRSVLVKKAEILPIECIVRGYIAGSAWRAYRDGKDIYSFPPGLTENQKLENPLFTPSTKAEQGAHDENITAEQAQEITPFAQKAGEWAVQLFKQASDHLATKGITLVDTKLEFGVIDGELILADEVFTPDSSRFVYAEDFNRSMDKEYVRKYLLTMDWDKKPPAPALPPEVIAETSKRYREIFKAITGDELV